MGMDYKYAGKVSYSKFNKEIEKLAYLFRGKDSEYRTKCKKFATDKTAYGIIAMRDYLYNHGISDEFVFPNNTSKALVRFLNHPYHKLTVAETTEISAVLNARKKEVEWISPQLLKEFDNLSKRRECWNIW